MSKQSIGAIVTPADREKAQPVLEALRAKGFAISEAPDARKKDKAVLLFLSQSFAADEQAQARFFALESEGREIIPVDLDGSAQPELVRAALIAKNAIPAQGRTAEEIAARVASAEVFQAKGVSPLLRRILIAAATALILGAAVWIWKSLQDGDGAAPGTGQTQAAPVDDFGMTAEDLAKIRGAVIVADKFAFFTDEDRESYGSWPNWEHFTYLDEWHDVHWYSVEDGHEFSMQHYDDLRVLGMMPNLRYLTLVLVDTDRLPDLSGASSLEYVFIQSCGIDSLEWLAGAPLKNLSVRFTPIGDFGPLSRCERLLDLDVDMYGTDVTTDFSAFAPPRLTNLRLWHANAGGTIDFSAMKDCTSLFSAYLGNVPIEDLRFLEGAKGLHELTLDQIGRVVSLEGIEGLPLTKLALRFCGELRDVAALKNMSLLSSLLIEGCGKLRELDAIAGCGALKEVELSDYPGTLDASFLASMPKLKVIRIGGSRLRNVDFLEGFPDNRRLELHLEGEIEDLSGLRFVKNYDVLHFSPRSDNNPRGSLTRIYPYLEGATVREMDVYNCSDVELDKFPTVTTLLSISNSDLDSLGKLPAWNLTTLRLDNLQKLTSLDGVGNLRAFSSGFRLALEISNCPRLEDWSAVENTELNRMRLQGLYYLPRFETIGLDRLELVGIPEMEELSVFGAMEDGRAIRQLLFREMEGLRDISALRRLKIEELSIPPQVEEQAQELVESGAVSRYEVLYPDGAWSPDESEIMLLELKELDTLPKALLRRVRSLWAAGDLVADEDRYERRDDWDHLLARNVPGTLLVDRESREETRVSYGKITELSAFSDLTGLEWLELDSQPIESLDGVQDLDGLRGLTLNACPKLTDISAVFAMQELEQLCLHNTMISSIQGVQNLEHLRILKLEGCEVRDLTPLAECDFSYAREQGGLCLSLGGLQAEDLSPLASIGSYDWLCLNGIDASLWLDTLEGCEVRSLCAHYGNMDQEQLERFLAAHGELETLEIPFNPKLRDLTPLLETENLQRVVVNGEMDQAIDSLGGKELPFALEIW